MPVEQLVYTDLPRGKGINPASAGYQIKACSEGLSAEARDLLSSICMHYGDAVYRYAPRQALDREMAWRAQTDILDIVPEQVLKEFPVIWSYDRLTDDLFALTKVRYSGLTHDRRPGNFFAHALVFAPDSLAQYRSNPLVLARLGPFLTDHLSDETRLPQLQDLGTPANFQTDSPMLLQAPYCDHLPAIISALCTATPATRPVVVCLADWRQAAQFVEALLNLLPLTARCRTTVCTCESDRTWLVPVKGARPAGLVAAHHLLVLCGPDDRTFNLRPDEYQSRYAIFNFVGDQKENPFSQLGEPRPFAKFAADCVKEGNMDRVKRHHELVEQFGFGQDVDAWDKLAPTADLRDGQRLEVRVVAEAAQSLSALATQPQQAQIALGLLWPHVEAMAQADDHAGLVKLSAELEKLANCLPTEAGQAPAPGFVPQVWGLAGKALVNGRARTATALLQACGQARDRLLLELLDQALSQPLTSSIADEQEPLMNLLCDGLRVAEKTPQAAPLFDRLLVATFRAAQAASRVADLWKSIGKELVQPRLSGDWNAEKQTLAQDLVACAPATICPEANAWLNLKRLNALKPQGESLFALLAEAAFASSRCAEAEKLASDLLRLAQDQLPNKEELAVAVGRMAEAAQGSTASGEKLFEAYREAIKSATSNRHFHIRRRLADAGVVRVLCRELLGEVLPWNAKDSPTKLQHWRDELLAAQPEVMDNLRQQVADLLRQPGQMEKALPLAEEILPRQGSKTTPGPGLRALYEAMVLGLPLQPMSQGKFSLSALRDNELTPEAATRLRLLKFMDEIRRLAVAPDWSTANFPHNDSVWSHDVRLLNSNEKRQILTWCIDTFGTSGVATPEHAQGLVKLMEAVDEKPPIADAVDQLLKGRDPVTSVLVMTAFARCGLEGSGQPEKWGLYVRAILERCDKTTRQLFEAHLAHRFGQRGEKYDERLRRFCAAAGISLPKTTALPQPQTAAPPVKAAGSSATVSPGAGQGFGVKEIVAWAKRYLLGEPEDSEQPPDRQGKPPARQDAKSKKRGRRSGNK